METTEVVIGDGAELVRFGLESLVNQEKDLNCVGAFSDDHDLLDYLSETKDTGPNLVLLDFTSPGFSIDTIIAIKNIASDTRVIAITPDQNSQTLVNALRVGVMSYIKKDCSIDEILDAIRATGKGNSFFCGKILETIEGESIDVEGLQVDPLNCSPVSLSPREIEIICLIAEGLTNNQIAEKLILSGHTINTHRKNIMAKLGVNNTAAIVMYAIKAQWVSPNKYLFSGASK